jgi:TRAP-type C4-dicarboxylate transport system permease large subunit
MTGVVRALYPALAWRPFLEPLPIDAGWLWLCVPLVLAVAVVYKTIKLPHLRDLPLESVKLAAQVLICMAGAALLLSLLTWLF